MLQGPPPFADLLRWRRESKANREEDDRFEPEVVRPDLTFLRANRQEPTLTWIGHVTFLLQLGGLNVLTDPHMTERASPLSFAGPRRRVPLPLQLAELPYIDVVLISHNHYDHLDTGTVRRLARQAGGEPLFLVPLGLAGWFRKKGVRRVEELDWWEQQRLDGVEFHFVPAQHWSKRALFDTNRSLWGGWIVDAGFRFHFAGDTGYSQDFQDIRHRFGELDLTALPIGAYAPRWFMRPQHVDPAEAVQIFKDLRARYAVAMHWGTFKLTDEPLDEPPQRLARELVEQGVAPERFFVMQHGATRRLAELAR